MSEDEEAEKKSRNSEGHISQDEEPESSRRSLKSRRASRPESSLRSSLASKRTLSLGGARTSLAFADKIESIPDEHDSSDIHDDAPHGRQLIEEQDNPDTNSTNPSTLHEKPDSVFSNAERESVDHEPGTADSNPQAHSTHDNPEGENQGAEVMHEEPKASPEIITEGVHEQLDPPHEELSAPNQEPEVPYQEPEVPHQEPEVLHQEPEVPHQEPEVPHQEPEVLHQEPEVPHQEPEVPHQEPEVPHQEPEVLHQEPEVPYQEPEVQEPDAPHHHHEVEAAHQELEAQTQIPERASNQETETLYGQTEDKTSDSEIIFQDDSSLQSEETEVGKSPNADNIKFSEPLNKPEELESQYEQLMGEDKSFFDILHDENSDMIFAALTQPAEVEPQQEQIPAVIDHQKEEIPPVQQEIIPSHTSQTATTNDVQDELSINQGRQQQDPFGAYEITPEDLFNEIKVARVENKDQENSQNLHSFIISKTFSSENVVVLLNLRRMNDGEWVLDKTIAQGLKPQTYGGVVSIDQYDFVDQPNKEQQEQHEEQPSSRSLKQSPSKIDPEAETTPLEPGNVCAGNKNIMDILQKLEDYVADVNREIQAAREILKRVPQCPDGEADATDSSCEPPQFNELPFLDKMVKMFAVIMADEDDPSCNFNLCDNNIETSFETQSAISYWLRSIIQEISNYCPAMLLPKAINDLRNIASTSAAIISQSNAMLEEVKKSGLLTKLSHDGLISATNSISGTLGGLPAISHDQISSALTALQSKIPSMGQLRLSSESASKSHVGIISEPHSNTQVGEHAESLSNNERAGTSLDFPTDSQIDKSSKSPSKDQFSTIKQPPDVLDASTDLISTVDSLQINIESKVDLDEFLKEHE